VPRPANKNRPFEKAQKLIPFGKKSENDRLTLPL
jgi:hypothetical protein